MSVPFWIFCPAMPGSGASAIAAHASARSIKARPRVGGSARSIMRSNLARAFGADRAVPGAHEPRVATTPRGTHPDWTRGGGPDAAAVRGSGGHHPYLRRKARRRRSGLTVADDDGTKKGGTGRQE